MQRFGKALDQVRAEEARRLKAEGKDPVLSKSRWCFLKRKENLTDPQALKLSELLTMNLRTVKAYLLTEDFKRFLTGHRTRARLNQSLSTCEAERALPSPLCASGSADRTRSPSI